MIVEIKDKDNLVHQFHDVECVYNINEHYTLCEELKNKILIVHSVNHCEKFRVYENARIISIKNKR